MIPLSATPWITILRFSMLCSRSLNFRDASGAPLNRRLLDNGQIH